MSEVCCADKTWQEEEAERFALHRGGRSTFPPNECPRAPVGVQAARGPTDSGEQLSPGDLPVLCVLQRLICKFQGSMTTEDQTKLNSFSGCTQGDGVLFCETLGC